MNYCCLSCLLFLMHWMAYPDEQKWKTHLGKRKKKQFLCSSVLFIFLSAVPSGTNMIHSLSFSFFLSTVISLKVSKKKTFQFVKNFCLFYVCLVGVSLRKRSKKLCVKVWFVTRTDFRLLLIFLFLCGHVRVMPWVEDDIIWLRLLHWKI